MKSRVPSRVPGTFCDMRREISLLAIFLVASMFSKSAMSQEHLKLDIGSLARRAKQVLVVHPVAGGKAKLELLEKSGPEYESKMEFPAVVGMRGFAPVGEKKEGDNKTPSGVFELGTAFGYAAKAKTKLPYRQSTEDDKIVTDPKSESYNTWVQGDAGTKKFDRLLRKDSLYELGIIINFNVDPVQKGLGSAIFIHVWKNANTGTAGSVAVAKESLEKVLAWLDPKKKPKIIINPAGL